MVRTLTHTCTAARLAAADNQSPLPACHVANDTSVELHPRKYWHVPHLICVASLTLAERKIMASMQRRKRLKDMSNDTSVELQSRKKLSVRLWWSKLTQQRQINRPVWFQNAYLNQTMARVYSLKIDDYLTRRRSEKLVQANVTGNGPNLLGSAVDVTNCINEAIKKNDSQILLWSTCIPSGS